MRDFGALTLPNLARAQQYDSDYDQSMDSDSSPTRRSSAHSTASDRSPITSSFSFRGSWKTSTVASSPASSLCAFDPMETFPNHSKNTSSLPDVAEDPSERDDMSDATPFAEQEENMQPLSTQRSWASSTNTRINLNIVPRDCSTRGSYFDFENEDEYIYEQSPPKRQRSSDGFMDKFVSRFPSLNKKTRDRKRPFTFASNSSSSSGSPYVGLSRSSSVTRSIFRRSASTEVDLDMPRSARVSCQIEPIAEMDDHEKMDLTQPDHIDENNFNRSDVETPTRVLTPLLPSVSGESDSRKSFQSPLQSPTVARYSDCGSSSQFSDFTNDTFAPGPTIVNRHLITSSPVAHSNTLSTSEVPTMLITDANDKWAGKLGHADFNIEPSPYMPAQCDRQSCQQLQANWQLARTEFTRHLARTNTHYGPSSKTYKLTEEKWNEIDAQWRQNYEQSMTQATENGSLPATDTPMEPVPIAKMLNDPWSEAKFPQRGDDVLVGPMEQAAPVQLARKPSKRRQFVQMLRMKR